MKKQKKFYNQRNNQKIQPVSIEKNRFTVKYKGSIYGIRRTYFFASLVDIFNLQ